MMPRRTRAGFTLVELLVVITIIGILMGLLIPAVNYAREVARRNQCSTQIKNLAYAAIQYENTHKGLPGYLNEFGAYNASAADPADPGNTPPAHFKAGGWAVSLFPSLDAQPIYERWTEDRYPLLSTNANNQTAEGYSGDSAPNLAIMMCPSSPTTDSSYGKNSYVANNGMFPNGSVPLAAAEDKANGAFNNKVGAVGPVGETVRLDDFKDGQGNTILFSENLQAQPWYLVAPPGSDASTTLAAGAPAINVQLAKCLQGFVWHQVDEGTDTIGLAPGATPAAPAMKINSGDGTLDKYSVQMTFGTGANFSIFARPSSAHTDGVNAGMASGQTRFINQSIDYRVYQALMTLRGKSSDVPFREYVLQDDAT